MERLPRDQKPETLAQIFFALLYKSPDNPADIDICETYYHLFGIMMEKELQRELEFLFECYTGTSDMKKEEKQWYKENWFYTFHKSLRQTDFYDGAVMVFSDRPLTDDEQKELRVLDDKYRSFKTPEDPTLRPSEQVAKWREEWREAYPTESARLLELVKKKNSQSNYSIAGHIAMALWSVIHLDKNNFLMMTMERTFNEYQLKLKYGRKEEQPADHTAQA